MATPKKMPSGKWKILVPDYKDDNGNWHRKSITADTKQECLYKASMFKYTERKNAPDLRVGDVIGNYITAKEKTLSPTTVTAYRSMLAHLFQPIARLYAQSIQPVDVQRWLGNLSVDHSPKTVRNALGLFTAALKFFGYDTPQGLKLPQKNRPRLYVPTDAEVLKMAEHFKNKGDKDMLIATYLGAYGTMRRGEVCALTAEDVDGNVIRITKAMVQRSKSGNDVTIKAPKTGSSVRAVEMPAFVIDLLPKEGRLVNLTPSLLSSRWAHAIKDAGLPHFRFHALRSYAASIMHALSVPDLYIMERGGWKSDATLKNIYRNSLSDYGQMFTDKTNAYFEKLNEEKQ